MHGINEVFRVTISTIFPEVYVMRSGSDFDGIVGPRKSWEAIPLRHFADVGLVTKDFLEKYEVSRNKMYLYVRYGTQSST